MQHAIVTEDDGADIFVIADATKGDFSVRRRSGRRVCAGTPVLIDPGIGFRAGSIENRNLVPRTCKVSGHWIAHDAKANKCNAHILVSPLLLACGSAFLYRDVFMPRCTWMCNRGEAAERL
jgi:hypothetical protein